MGIHNEVDEVKGQINVFRDHLIITREQSIIKSESAPYLIYQMKKQVAESTAMGKMMFEIQEDLGLQFMSQQSAVRDLSRTSETLTQVRKYLDTSLKNNRTLKEQHIADAERMRDQQIRLDILETSVGTYTKMVEEIKQILEERKAPSDMEEELARILHEEPQPKALPQAEPLGESEQTEETPPGEEREEQ